MSAVMAALCYPSGQKCVPVCFKHLLRPRSEPRGALSWAVMWSPACWRAGACRQRSVRRKQSCGGGWRWTQSPREKTEDGGKEVSKPRWYCQRHSFQPFSSQGNQVCLQAKCVLACFLPLRISVRASLSAPLLWLQQETEGDRTSRQTAFSSRGEYEEKCPT